MNLGWSDDGSAFVIKQVVYKDKKDAIGGREAFDQVWLIPLPDAVEVRRFLVQYLDEKVKAHSERVEKRDEKVAKVEAMQAQLDALKKELGL